MVLTTDAGPNLHPSCAKRFAIAELMAYVAGWDDVAWLARFNKNIGQFSDDGITFRGAYGPRMAWSWATLFELLERDPDTRQAICQIYTPDDLTVESKDKPCNTSFQLQVIDGFLHMTVYQRSCDLVWGFPYDHFSFCTILILMANQLNLLPGTVTRLMANAHVYEPHAQFYGIERVMKAMEPAQVEMWYPPVLKFDGFRNAAIEARRVMESSGKVFTSEAAKNLAFFLEGTS